MTLRNSRRRKISPSMMAGVGALLVTVVYVVPIYWMFVTSIKRDGDIFSSPPVVWPASPTLESYLDVAFQNSALWVGLANSVVISVGATLVTLCVAVPAAYALARLNLRFTALVLLLFLVVQMVPPINLALPLFTIFTGAGLINTHVGLILANCALSVPLAVTIMRPYFLAIPGEIVEAARVDGCTQFSAFIRVVLPVTTPGLVTIAAITFVGAWAEYTFALTLNSNETIRPVTMVLADYAYYAGVRWNDLMAVSVLAALPVVIVFALLQRHIIAGLTSGATKG